MTSLKKIFLLREGSDISRARLKEIPDILYRDTKIGRHLGKEKLLPLIDVLSDVLDQKGDVADAVYAVSEWLQQNFEGVGKFGGKFNAQDMDRVSARIESFWRRL